MFTCCVIWRKNKRTSCCTERLTHCLIDFSVSTTGLHRQLLDLGPRNHTTILSVQVWNPLQQRSNVVCHLPPFEQHPSSSDISLSGWSNAPFQTQPCLQLRQCTNSFQICGRRTCKSWVDFLVCFQLFCPLVCSSKSQCIHRQTVPCWIPLLWKHFFLFHLFSLRGLGASCWCWLHWNCLSHPRSEWWKRRKFICWFISGKHQIKMRTSVHHRTKHQNGKHFNVSLDKKCFGVFYSFECAFLFVFTLWTMDSSKAQRFMLTTGLVLGIGTTSDSVEFFLFWRFLFGVLSGELSKYSL